MFREYLALRRLIKRPWRFLLTRKKPLGTPHEDIEFKEGFSVRLRNVPMDRHIFHRIFGRDEYRLEGTAPGAWGTVIDVGAHIGLFAVRVAPLARRVLCYEPVPENFEVLRRNLAHPRFGHLMAAAKAVAGRPGTVSIHRSDNPAAHSMYPAEPSRSEPIRVEAVRIEDIFEEHRVDRCDLLKLDCEGAEYEILESIPPPLWGRIERVRMEYHAREGWSGEKLAALLTGQGYACDVLPSRKPGKGHLFAARKGPG